MKLIYFSLTNFRSITTAHKISLHQTTILIGRNNEGKSNILKGLNTAMTILQDHAMSQRRLKMRSIRRRDESSYIWERDFPIGLQSRKSGLQTIFRLEFTLNDDDVALFNDNVQSKINGSLTIEIKIGKDNVPNIRVLEKRGKGSKALNSKSGKIAEFIAKNIVFNYIPAIRTDIEAMDVVRDMLMMRMRVLETEEEYKNALETIRKIQEPVLKELSDQIKIPLKEFLPTVESVTVYIPDDARRLSMRSDFEIIVDDGTATSLAYKGDGVKSLAALGLLKNRLSTTGASIIAIEEPESHLHPAAIHQLNEVIVSLGNNNQVVLTTHNPLFVDRDDIKSNIIVNEGKAIPAKNTKQIRDILGIKASDNLINASYVLIVEGEDDVISLKGLLPFLSDKIAKALKSNLLVIDQIGGAGNLSYKLTLLNNSLCVYHCLLDHDEAGREAYQKAENDGLLSIKNNTFITCNGSLNSEFEDCLNLDVYYSAVLSEFSVDLKSPMFKSNKTWSDRVKNVFLNQGKTWNAKIESQVKYVVANSVKNAPEKALNDHKRNSIDALVKNLEALLKS
ncbi:MAG: ATP-binding protein [Methylobacter sp.]|uniref:ATP-dependent nuclease n=1 Tax=Methylobacter sp. TaxID=2051955 RepID=UPI002585DFA5|nr:ATP-binding protein [Methylobacter sp.]MCL7422783.1 ATP-binding protein [Methylobacter sp.]